MKNKIPRKLFLGFMQIHILISAKKEPFFGLGMIEELDTLDYKISPGTLYPILHKLEEENLLLKESKICEGKVRNYYSITKEGLEVLEIAKEKAFNLFKELDNK